LHIPYPNNWNPNKTPQNTGQFSPKKTSLIPTSVTIPFWNAFPIKNIKFLDNRNNCTWNSMEIRVEKLFFWLIKSWFLTAGQHSTKKLKSHTENKTNLLWKLVKRCVRVTLHNLIFLNDFRRSYILKVPKVKVPLKF